MSIRIGRILGIPVSVDASWFVILALVVYSLAVGYFPRVHPELSPAMDWLGGLIAALLLFSSVLLHEVMHSFVAKRGGLAVGGITLFMFGGVSQLSEEPRSAGEEFRMAIVGPLTSIGLGIAFWLVATVGGIAGLGQFGHAILSYLGYINVLLGVFNLLPGFPLDGGRVLRAALWGATENLESATRIASYVGQGFGYVLVGIGFLAMLMGGFLGGLWFAFIGWYLLNAAQQSYRQLVVQRALSGVSVGQIMGTDFPRLDPDMSVSDFVHDYLLRYDCGGFPVVRNGDLLGVITVDEVRELPKDQWEHTTVRTLARPPAVEREIDENVDAFDAMMHMMRGNLRCLLVMHEGKLRGMVTVDSLATLMRTKMRLGI